LGKAGGGGKEKDGRRSFQGASRERRTSCKLAAAVLRQPMVLQGWW
jgi:hypothetical protein